jgi:hypothetical protein
MHEPEASITDGFASISDLVLNVACPKHRSVAGFRFVFDAIVNRLSIGFNLLSSIFYATLPRLLLPLYTL